MGWGGGGVGWPSSSSGHSCAAAPIHHLWDGGVTAQRAAVDRPLLMGTSPQPWDIPMWGHPNVGTSQCGDIPVWGHPNVGTSQCGDIPVWGHPGPSFPCCDPLLLGWEHPEVEMWVRNKGWE